MFATSVLRTLFLEFEAADWEEELEDFHNTDVDVPCTLTVDGRFYPNVGVSFRGASSYMMVPRGAKRSLNLSMDLANPDQHLHGHRTLNLLNGHGDPSLMSTVLYSHIAMRRIPTPRANFVRVVINGESWGVYTCVEQFNKDFVKDRFGTDSGARWKVKGSPNGRSGLDYTGDDLAVYRARYQIKSKDREEDWHALVNLCRTLSEAPLDELEEALRPILNIDGALWFLALDIVLVNSDGYWTRASDYNLYRDPKGVFHIVPHDMNEAFSNTVGGPRRGTGGPGEMARPPATQPRRSGTTLDPRVGMNDAGKPLRSRLLAVPSLRTRYLEMVHAIASEDLSWDALGTVVDEYRNLIDAEVQADTRKLASYDAFVHATSPDLADGVVQPEGAGDRGRRRLSLRQFVDQRRQFLLEYLNEKPSPAETGEASH